MMMIPPRPCTPYLPIYPEADQARIWAEYQRLDREWQRDAQFVLWTSAIPLVCVTIGLIVAAFMVPSIVLDAITILMGK